MFNIKKSAIRQTIIQLILISLSLLYLLPAWMIIVNSFKEYKDAVRFKMGFAAVMNLDNYIQVIKKVNIPRALFNAVTIESTTIVLAIFISSAGAFVIARRVTKFTKFCYGLYLALLVVPGAPVPTYFIMRWLGLIDTYQGLITIFTALCIPFNSFFYSGFIKTIPRELDNAATIDGCGPIRTFLNVAFPLLKPATVTLILFNFMGIWNDVGTYIYYSSTDKWVLPMTVYKFIGNYNIEWNYVFAHIVISVLPILIVYLAGRKHVIDGLVAGAVKG